MLKIKTYETDTSIYRDVRKLHRKEWISEVIVPKAQFKVQQQVKVVEVVVIKGDEGNKAQ